MQDNLCLVFEFKVYVYTEDVGLAPLPVVCPGLRWSNRQPPRISRKHYPCHLAKLFCLILVFACLAPTANEEGLKAFFSLLF